MVSPIEFSGNLLESRCACRSRPRARRPGGGLSQPIFQANGARYSLLSVHNSVFGIFWAFANAKGLDTPSACRKMIQVIAKHRESRPHEPAPEPRPDRRRPRRGPRLRPGPGARRGDRDRDRSPEHVHRHLHRGHRGEGAGAAGEAPAAHRRLRRRDLRHPLGGLLLGRADHEPDARGEAELRRHGRLPAHRERREVPGDREPAHALRRGHGLQPEGLGQRHRRARGQRPLRDHRPEGEGGLDARGFGRLGDAAQGHAGQRHSLLGLHPQEPVPRRGRRQHRCGQDRRPLRLLPLVGDHGVSRHGP